MYIPTEPIGSIPRPPELINAPASGAISPDRLGAMYDAAVRDTIARFEETGSPVITDAGPTAFAMIRLPAEGTAMAAAILEGSR